MPYNPVDLAYIAGVMDSDGYIGIVRHPESRRKKRTISYVPRFVILQTRLEAMSLIKNLFGGYIYKLKNPKSKNWKTKYSFQINRREDVTKILTEILPYLRIKKRQAEVVLLYNSIRSKKLSKKKCSKNTYGNEEKKLWQNVRSLNQTGREVQNSDTY